MARLSPMATTRAMIGVPAPSRSGPHRHLGVDRGMRIVAHELEVLIGEVEQRADLGIDLHAGKRAGSPFELLAGLVEMGEIEMGVAERMDELSGFEARHLRHHQREQRVRGDVEGHAEKDIGRALIELAGEPPVGNIELEQAMAGESAILSSSPTFQALTMWRRESGSRFSPSTSCAI